MGNWTAEPEIRMDLNIWYPARRMPRELNFSPWVIEATLNAKPAEGKFPLLALSHPTEGTRFSYHKLAAFLAVNGFIVVAPTHGHDSMNNMDDLLTWTQLERRAKEIEQAIGLSLKEKDLARVADPKRIGLIGFGSGATVALLLGGALPSCGGWREYCKRAGSQDAYCNPWAKGRIDSLCKNLPLQKSMADQRIKAITAIAPGFGMIFDKDSFAHFHPPLLLVSAGRDKFNVPALHCEAIGRILGSKAKYLDLPGADSGALMSECPAGYAQELPELCLSVTSEQRKRLFKNLSGALLSFFSHYLQNEDNLPRIPAPPDLAPAAEPAPESAQPKGRNRGGKKSP